MVLRTRKRKQSKSLSKSAKGSISLKSFEPLIGKSREYQIKQGSKTHKQRLTLTGNVVERPNPRSMILYKGWLRTRKPRLTAKKTEVELKTSGGDYVYVPFKNGKVSGMEL
jgi:hypothetical protein